MLAHSRQARNEVAVAHSGEYEGWKLNGFQSYD